MRSCCICHNVHPCDGALLDGRTFHQSCYSRLREETETLAKTEKALLTELAKPSSLGERLGTFLFGSPSEKTVRHKKHLADTLQITRNEIQANVAVLESVFDVWPDYPPDWDRRRELVQERDDYCCSGCGVGNLLEVHHRRSIAEGGTHRLDNLVLLCKFCHSEAHGGRELRYKEPSGGSGKPITAISQKVAAINRALANGRDIRFRYKKPNGAVTQRTVTPRELRTHPATAPSQVALGG